ncbi:MAG: hypothetical protein UGF89_08505 [Acutalibacteraceae bacterium]|nr:hypothetical protein [Acutalibacteraceae bacterium]
MTKKQFIRSIAFFLAVGILVLSLCDLFELENTSNFNKRYETYRDFPDDTVEAVLLGTSGIDRYWVPSQAYEEHGITVYPLSVDAFPAWLYKYAIEEALDYQDIQLFILDIRPFTQANTSINTMDVRARRFLDALPPFSMNRIQACFKTMEIRDEVDSSASRLDLSYLFPIIKFHGKWSDDDYLIGNNWSALPHEYLGYHILQKATVRPSPQRNRGYRADYFYDLDPYSKETLYELIDYIKENELNVLFIDTPQVRFGKESGRSNTIYKILEEEGMDYLHFYDENSENTFTIDLDLKTDFYNPGHLNFYGATKFTSIFADYLIENYGLEDKRNQEHVKEHWDGVHDRLLEKIAELEEAREQRLAASEAENAEAEE